MAYRGKYPTRINSVWTNPKTARGFAFVKTNAGSIYKIPAKSTDGRFPNLGDDIACYPAAVVAYYHVTP